MIPPLRTTSRYSGVSPAMLPSAPITCQGERRRGDERMRERGRERGREGGRGGGGEGGRGEGEGNFYTCTCMYN